MQSLLPVAFAKAQAIPFPYSASQFHVLDELCGLVRSLSDDEQHLFRTYQKALWVVMVARWCWEYLKEPPFPSGRWALERTRVGGVVVSNWGLFPSLNETPCKPCEKLGDSCTNTAGLQSSRKCRPCLLYNRNCNLHDAGDYNGRGAKRKYSDDEARRQAHNLIHKEALAKHGGAALIRKEQRKRKAMRDIGVEVGQLSYASVLEQSRSAAASPAQSAAGTTSLSVTSRTSSSTTEQGEDCTPTSDIYRQHPLPPLLPMLPPRMAMAASRSRRGAGQPSTQDNVIA